MSKAIVALTTDFGNNDHFVGTMRGTVLTVNPEAQVVDLSHGIGAFDVLDGAMTIAAAYAYFPTDTIHVVVVDPGVGSTRRPLLVTTTRHLFLAPDNGVLSLVMEQEERVSVRHITAEHYFLQPLSRTFHGRDVFAPCAGWLSKGVEPAKFGEEITDYIRFRLPQPKPAGERTLRGAVLKADRFGNLITNFTAANAPQLFVADTPLKITVGQTPVAGLRQSYTEGQAGELVALFNSMGYLEIASYCASAAQLTHALRGTPVTIEF